jgi:hypothetical protein
VAAQKLVEYGRIGDQVHRLAECPDGHGILAVDQPGEAFHQQAHPWFGIAGNPPAKFFQSISLVCLLEKNAGPLQARFHQSGILVQHHSRLFQAFLPLAG